MSTSWKMLNDAKRIAAKQHGSGANQLQVDFSQLESDDFNANSCNVNYAYTQQKGFMRIANDLYELMFSCSGSNLSYSVLLIWSNLVLCCLYKMLRKWDLSLISSYLITSILPLRYLPAPQWTPSTKFSIRSSYCRSTKCQLRTQGRWDFNWQTEGPCPDE